MYFYIIIYIFTILTHIIYIKKCLIVFDKRNVLSNKIDFGFTGSYLVVI